MGPKLPATATSVNPNYLRTTNVEIDVAVPKILLAMSFFKADLSVLSYIKCFSFLLTTIIYKVNRIDYLIA